MLSRAFQFLAYHNAVPVGLSLLLLSSGAAFAASPDARDAVFSATQTVVSVDNSYIVTKDLSSYVPAIQIIGVTEDTDYYYIAYTLTTIDIEGYVWKDVTKDKVLKVAKASLQGSDLGLYATRQLKEVVDAEIAYLKRVQDIERAKGRQSAVVAIAYSGLVGKFFDNTTETLPGYTPVITPPAPEEDTSAENASGPAEDGTSDVSIVSSGSDRTPPNIYILGNNPAQIPIHATYSDLGAAITDNVNDNLGYKTEGAAKVDTSAPGTFTVTYTATDQAGNTRTAARTVIVYDPAKGPPVPASEVKSETPPPAPQISEPVPSASVTEPQTTESEAATSTVVSPAVEETAEDTSETTTSQASDESASSTVSTSTEPVSADAENISTSTATTTP